jgi:hypothetical protein
MRVRGRPLLRRERASEHESAQAKESGAAVPAAPSTLRRPPSALISLAPPSSTFASFVRSSLVHFFVASAYFVRPSF